MQTVSFNDFKKLDIRIGTISSVSIPEGSNKIYKIIVDFGDQIGTKTIFAGLKPFYEKEKLIGKQIAVIINLEPKEFFGEKGEGMLLAADEDGIPILLSTEKRVKNGSIIR